jgi:hypothetical protein
MGKNQLILEKGKKSGLIFTKILTNILRSFLRQGCLKHRSETKEILTTFGIRHHYKNYGLKIIVRSFLIPTKRE